MRSQSSMQWLLCMVAVLLTLNLVVQVVALSAPAPAMAQSHYNAGDNREPPTPFPNNAEQFKRMNDSLGDVRDRLGRIESKLDKGINVKVTEMPAIEMKNPPKAE